MAILSNKNLNNEYLRLKAAVEKYKVDLEKSENDLKTALTNKQNAENALNAAKTDKEKKQFQNDLNKAITEIEDIKNRVEGLKERTASRQEEINSILNELKSRPEIQEQIKRAIDIRTDRNIDKFEKQKKEQKEKKATMEQLKNIINKHPQAITYVNFIEGASLEISKNELKIENIQKKIDELDPKDYNYVSEKAKLDGEISKLKAECKSFETVRTRSRNELKKLLNNPKYNEYIDNFTTRKALDKDIRNCDRLVKRSENKIHDYQYAKDSLYVGQAVNSAPANQTPTNQNPAQPTRWETFKEDVKNVFSKKRLGDPSRLTKVGNVFKNLFKRQNALPAPITTAPATTAPVNSFKDDVKVDNNIMKYEVVQELYKQEMNDKVNEGKQQRDNGSR